MKPKPILIAALLLVLAPIILTRANEAGAIGDKTLSPYFVVQSSAESGGSDPMPLKATDVHVTIAGVIADVSVKQTYANAGNAPLEASYVFPGSTRAAVYAMQMTVGGRVLKAQVQRRDEARQTYEQAKVAGKSTSLLEQQRPNVFQMNVANILPGDTVEVEMRYTELLVPEAGEYEFAFPTVIGPRYSNLPEGTAPAADRWVANPYLMKGTTSPATFALAVEVLAGMPLQGLRCDTHPAVPEFVNASHARIKLAPGDATANNRDFILRYRLADGRIETGLLLAKGAPENFFLLTVQPPKPGVATALPPRDYLFVLDVSGSMRGFPLECAKGLIRQLLGTLTPGDTFNVLLFSGGSTLLSPEPLPATPANLARALGVIDHEHGGGGTELLPALRQALATPNARDAARSIVVVTDGFVDCETEAFDLIRSNLDRANLFAFGIGSSVNRFLIEGMARAGQGEPFIVTRPDEAPEVVSRFRHYIGAPLLAHVKLDFGGLEVYDVEPASVPDVLADRPVTVFGKWRGTPGGTVTVRGKSGAGDFVQSLPLADARVLEDANPLRYLWARTRIATLGDYHRLRPDSERVREITTLGLSYNLLTAWTSFVAVDDVVRNAGGHAPLVKQPLPLPQGVENSAVGGGGGNAPIPTTPEPETWVLIVVVAAIFGRQILKARRARCA